MRSAAFGCMAHCCAVRHRSLRASRFVRVLMSEIKTQSTKPVTRGGKRESEKRMVNVCCSAVTSASLLLMPQRKDLTDGGN